MKSLKANTHLRYKLSEEAPWTEATITSRAGKASSKSRYWWNIINADGSAQSIDLSKVIDFQIKSDNTSDSCVDTRSQTPNTECIIDEAYLAQSKEKELNAKLLELNQWKQQQVYEEIEDSGQECIS